jgi:hypothetical protein
MWTLIFLPQLVPYSGSAGSNLAQHTLVHPHPKAFGGPLALPLHPCHLEVLFIICGNVYCLEILFFIFSTGFDRYSGKGRGEASIWFCFMICRGGSVKFSEDFGPGGVGKMKGNSDGL